MSIYKKAIEFFGPQNQLRQLQEEASELSAAINHLFRGHDIEKVFEEIADVEIVIKQIRIFFGNTRINKIKKEKLNRLSKIIKTNREIIHGQEEKTS